MSATSETFDAESSRAPIVDLYPDVAPARSGLSVPPGQPGGWQRPHAAGAVDPRFARPECLFFGIGAQKAATSWVHDYLSGHPEVLVPGFVKELHYWDTARPPFIRVTHDRVAGRQARRGLQHVARRYLAPARHRQQERNWSRWHQVLTSGGLPPHEAYADMLFDGWNGQRAVGELTPEYALLDSETFREMDRLSANTRFFFVMRDPLERMVSAISYLYPIRSGKPIDTDSFNRLLEITLEDDCELCLERSQYDRTITALEAAVPSDKIAYFFYETLFDQAEIDRLTGFLGIERRSADLARSVNSHSKAAFTPDPALMAEARRRLAPQYDAMAAKFGALPERWQRNYEGA
ncbi:sulfotransferase [Primorskyibacter sp. 2E107]|uniref:sulfotransferase n=1 Tax=Primorskyibacter sp. 2E107 TaxID=3403458 RepID=UPI003AF72D8D